jgi:hypothetical protein
MRPKIEAVVGNASGSNKPPFLFFSKGRLLKKRRVRKDFLEQCLGVRLRFVACVFPAHPGYSPRQ